MKPPVSVPDRAPCRHRLFSIIVCVCHHRARPPGRAHSGRVAWAPPRAPCASPVLGAPRARSDVGRRHGRVRMQVALRGIANVALTVAGDTATLREIEATFRGLDEDGDGRVPYAAVVHYLKQGDFDLSDTETEVLISQMDVDEAGFIRYDEWLAAMLEWRMMQVCRRVCLRACAERRCRRWLCAAAVARAEGKCTAQAEGGGRAWPAGCVSTTRCSPQQQAFHDRCLCSERTSQLGLLGGARRGAECDHVVIFLVQHRFMSCFIILDLDGVLQGMVLLPALLPGRRRAGFCFLV